MALVDFEKFHNQVMEAKKKGTPIGKTLKEFGVPSSTYYRMIDENGEDKWTIQRRGKVVTKQKRMIKVHKRKQDFIDEKDNEFEEKNFLGMSGGGLDGNFEEGEKFSGDVGLYIEQAEKGMQKYYDRYNIK